MPTQTITVQPQPKILSVVTVPTGGWTIKVYLSNAGQYDTAVTATMDAGDYFMAGDQQDSCFVHELASKLNTACKASIATAHVFMWIDDDGKVSFGFEGDHYQGATKQDVKIAWTENNGSSIGGVLGFDVSADDTATGSDNPTITSDWQHAYGWYAFEDGLLAEAYPVDWDEPTSLQAVTPLGHATTHYIGARKRNVIRLQNVPQSKMWSDDVAYTAASIHPYERNKPLECWWQEARQGKRFRVYWTGEVSTTAKGVLGSANRPVDQGTPSSTATTTVTDSSKSWDIDPQEHKARTVYVGGILRGASVANITNCRFKYYINSHTASALTLANSLSGDSGYKPSTNDYYVLDHRYRTYVVDLNQMKEFKPTEIPHIDEYNITIPLIKYQA